LRDLGYVEGKTFVLELRYSEARGERLPELARELVGLKMDVIVAVTDRAIAAVKRETQTIPIVMINSSDPVGTGFVASLGRPGRNVTGLSNISAELSGNKSDPIFLDTVSTTMTAAKEVDDERIKAEADSWQ
jgi:putative ABC transport system substrate-binding protein